MTGDASAGAQKDRLGQPGQPAYGMWIKMASLETLELIAGAGCDFVILDLEHSMLGIESVYRSAVVCQGRGLAVFVRVPDRSGSYTQRLLDAGVDGLLVPHVDTPEQALEAVQQMTFPPFGTRGMGLTSRAGRWGLEPTVDYLERGVHGVVRAVQVESLEGLERGDEILATPFLDAALIGFADLSQSTGLPPDDPGLARLVDDFVRSASARNIPCGTAVTTAEAAQSRTADGFSFVVVGNDVGIFAQAVNSLFRELRVEAIS